MRRRNAVATAVVAVVAAAIVMTANDTSAGGSAMSFHAADVKPSHTPYVRLASGTSGGVAWLLYGWEQEHQLCLYLVPAGSDPDHPPTAGAQAWTGGGGCGFDDSHPGSGFFFGTDGPDGGSVSFGPLPAAATRIRVATHEFLPTTPLPAGQGLPAGRFWIAFTGANGSSTTEGDVLPTPEPLDTQGRPVAFQRF